jgi:hypothetical protein
MVTDQICIWMLALNVILIINLSHHKNASIRSSLNETHDKFISEEPLVRHVAFGQLRWYRVVVPNQVGVS